MTNDHAMRGGIGRLQSSMTGALVDWHSANSIECGVEVVWLPPAASSTAAASRAKEWMRRMPWPCAPPGSHLAALVASLLGVDPNFSLTLFHPSGAILTRRAWDRVRVDPRGESFPWTLPPVPRLLAESAPFLEVPGGGRVPAGEHLAGANYVALYFTQCAGTREACFRGRRRLARLLALLSARKRAAVLAGSVEALGAARMSSSLGAGTEEGVWGSTSSLGPPPPEVLRGRRDAEAARHDAWVSAPGGGAGQRRASVAMSGLGSAAMTPRDGASMIDAPGSLMGSEMTGSAAFSASEAGGVAGGGFHWQAGAGADDAGPTPRVKVRRQSNAAALPTGQSWVSDATSVPDDDDAAAAGGWKDEAELDEEEEEGDAAAAGAGRGLHVVMGSASASEAVAGLPSASLPGSSWVSGGSGATSDVWSAGGRGSFAVGGPAVPTAPASPVGPLGAGPVFSYSEQAPAASGARTARAPPSGADRPVVGMRVVVVAVDAHSSAVSVDRSAFADFVSSLPRGFACVPHSCPRLGRALCEAVRLDTAGMLRGPAAGRPVLCVVDSAGRLLTLPGTGQSVLDALATDPDGFPWPALRSAGVTPLLDTVQGLLAARG